jgi:anti-sigma factor RsiW
MELNQHASDDTLEAYVMLTLPDTEVGPVERHLIICRLCCWRFSEMDKLVTAMHAAAKEYRRIQEKSLLSKLAG